MHGSLIYYIKIIVCIHKIKCVSAMEKYNTCLAINLELTMCGSKELFKENVASQLSEYEKQTLSVYYFVHACNVDGACVLYTHVTALYSV